MGPLAPLTLLKLWGTFRPPEYITLDIVACSSVLQARGFSHWWGHSKRLNQPS